MAKETADTGAGARTADDQGCRRLQQTVLAVDDEPASRRTLQRVLGAECEVVTAAGGAAALAVLASRPVSLLIADQRMPDMTGTELLAACAARCPDVVRVLLTGYTDVDTLADAINAGHVYAYVAKPWEPREVRLVVRRGLERFMAEAERRRLVRELERSCERVRRESAQKTRLLALAAHELGTPVHLVGNAVDLIAAAGVAPEAQPWLETARRGASWLGRIVAQLGRGAQALPQGLRLRRQALEVHGLVSEAFATLARGLHCRRLTFSADLPAALPRLSGDPVWLGRALVGLLSNAVRSTPDGGCVSVDAQSVAGAIEIAVRDSGVGIDPSLLDDIFEPFSAAAGDLALHSSGWLEFGTRGLGLGLAITKRIVEEHGGRLSVTSQPGAGSCFRVCLPATTAAADAGACCSRQ